ncbi:MAG UNVERIFIED_CONTAM: hypothetical protein LVR18_25635 [Planctomycetaceae bacterium]
MTELQELQNGAAATRQQWTLGRPEEDTAAIGATPAGPLVSHRAHRSVRQCSRGPRSGNCNPLSIWTRLWSCSLQSPRWTKLTIADSRSRRCNPLVERVEQLRAQLNVDLSRPRLENCLRILEELRHPAAQSLGK